MVTRIGCADRTKNGHMPQKSLLVLVRLPFKQEVAGSIPVCGTRFAIGYIIARVECILLLAPIALRKKN